MDKDGIKEAQRKYEEKSKPYTELEDDPGALGATRDRYESNKKPVRGEPISSQSGNRYRRGQG